MNPGGAGGITGPGGSANSADINQIPADLIERVDVLTGGASAVYGADAVAGVVNFVTQHALPGRARSTATTASTITRTTTSSTWTICRQRINRFRRARSTPDRTEGRFDPRRRELRRRQGQRHHLRHVPQHLAGGRLPVRPRRLHAQRRADSRPAPSFCGGSSTSATGRFFAVRHRSAPRTTTLADNTVDAATGAFRGI